MPLELLARFPRVSLGHFPTPLEPLPRLTRHLGGPRLYVKRDDCSGLAAGGNKARKLEFLLGDALRREADCVITVGALQSNHCRQTAAACARLGLECHLILRRGVPVDTAAYNESGNVLLDHMFGARVTFIPREQSREETMARLADDLTVQGRRPYAIPVGGTNLEGDLGYVACAKELHAQCEADGIAATHLLVATGTGGTQAGLVAGLHALGSALRVVGISIEGKEAQQRDIVLRNAAEAAAAVGAGRPLPEEAVRVAGGYFGPGYGLPTAGMREALELAARLEGLLLDPVYTGKAMAGLIGLVREGALTSRDTVIFMHTGGLPGLFAYPDVLSGG
jgi:D-cysteine desulfhydrase family pyridoxal phosphate-dependent enzyme